MSAARRSCGGSRSFRPSFASDAVQFSVPTVAAYVQAVRARFGIEEPEGPLEERRERRARGVHHCAAGGGCCYHCAYLSDMPEGFGRRVLAWKDTPDAELSERMGNAIAECLFNRSTFDFVTTAPRKVERVSFATYHPSETVARIVAARIGKPFRHVFKIRTRHRPRGRYSPEMPPELLEPISGAFVLLVDDVICTGKTARACASLLRANGNDVETFAFLYWDEKT